MKAMITRFHIESYEDSRPTHLARTTTERPVLLHNPIFQTGVAPGRAKGAIAPRRKVKSDFFGDFRYL